MDYHPHSDLGLVLQFWALGPSLHHPSLIQILESVLGPVCNLWTGDPDTSLLRSLYRTFSLVILTCHFCSVLSLETPPCDTNCFYQSTAKNYTPHPPRSMDWSELLPITQIAPSCPSKPATESNSKIKPLPSQFAWFSVSVKPSSYE